jgi:hypothetical protein
MTERQEFVVELFAGAFMLTCLGGALSVSEFEPAHFFGRALMFGCDGPEYHPVHGAEPRTGGVAASTATRYALRGVGRIARAGKMQL